jgi:prevent-host-death family protein
VYTWFVSETVSVRELRADLAACLDRAADGEPVTITRHGHPAAVLEPYDDEADVDGLARRKDIA